MLLVVSEASAGPDELVQLGSAAATGGAWGLMLRAPALSGQVLYTTAARLVAAHPGLRILVSDRLDVAVAAGAFGCQLGERGLPLMQAQDWVGGRLRLGRSVHDIAGARAAATGGADWLIFGHVYATASKPGLPPAGLAGLRAAVAASSRPVLAIGGIDAARVPAVRQAGASGVAVIGAVSRAADPVAAIRELVRALAAEPRGGQSCVESSP